MAGREKGGTMSGASRTMSDDERDWIVVAMADRELLPGEPLEDSYRELKELNPDANLTTHVCTPLHYGPFTEAEARVHAERVEGGAHKLISPVVASRGVPDDREAARQAMLAKSSLLLPGRVTRESDRAEARRNLDALYAAFDAGWAARGVRVPDEPTDAMVQAAARAHFAALGDTTLNLDDVPATKALWLNAARAALTAALRVPDERKD